jgi:SAM-dependent methyltransferase
VTRATADLLDHPLGLTLLSRHNLRPMPAGPGSGHLTCPICAAPAAHYCTKPGTGRDWEIARCTGECGHGFVINRPTAQFLNELYAGVEETPEASRTHTAGAAYFEGLGEARGLAVEIATMAPTGRSLDVGSGDGAVSYHLAKLGFSPLLIDLSERAERQAAQIPGAIYRAVPWEELADPGPFAAIVMSQVLEHALDPAAWLAKAAALLGPGGVLFVGLPNFGGVYRLLGARDPFICPPYHLNYFTPRSIRRAVGTVGLTVRRMAFYSGIVTAHPAIPKLSLRRRALGYLWNMLFAKPADWLGKGIMLGAYASLR